LIATTFLALEAPTWALDSHRNSEQNAQEFTIWFKGEHTV
jgi:hypothetical protein